MSYAGVEHYYEQDPCPTCGQQQKSDEWVALRWKPVLDKYEIPDDGDLQVRVARAFEDITDTFKRILPSP